MKTVKLGMFALLIVFAGAARGVVIPDTTPQDEADAKAVLASLKAYDEVIIKGDREKAASFYAVADEEDKKLNAIYVDLDIKIEGLHQAVVKRFGAAAWEKIGPIVGGVVPGYTEHAKVTPDPQTGQVTVDPYPQAKQDSVHRWFAEIPMEQGKEGWVFVDVDSSKGAVAERVEQRRWYRDAIAEIEEITAGVAAGKWKEADALEAAVQKTVNETIGSEDGTTMNDLRVRAAAGQ